MKKRLVFMGLILGAVVFFSGKTARAEGSRPEGFSVLGKTVTEDNDWLTAMDQKAKSGNWQEVKHPQEENQPKISDQDKKKGYLVFTRHYLDPVYYNSLPEEFELGKNLQLFASLGEYEPVSFSVYALEEVKEIKLSVSNLSGKKGEVIDKANIDLRVVRLIPCGIGKENKYELNPGLLEKRESVNIAKGTTQQFWVTVRVPENAQPGFYEATIEIAPANRKPSTLKLQVRALPIRLEEPDVNYGLCFFIPPRKGLYPDNLDKYFLDMKAHGMNSMWTWPNCDLRKEDGNLVFDFSKIGPQPQNPSENPYFYHSLEEMVKGYLKAGYKREWLCGTPEAMRSVIAQKLGYQHYTKEFDAALIEGMRQLLRKAKEENWPPFPVSIIDEPANAGADGEPMRLAKYYYKLIRENFPGVKTCQDLNGMWHGVNDGQILSPWLDIRNYNFVNEQVIRETKEAKEEFWIYNLSDAGYNPKIDRFIWGLYARKIEAKGVFSWVYMWWQPVERSSYNQYVFGAPDGPIPTLAWEGVREGTDDMKYIATLGDLIKKAKESGNPQLLEKAKNAAEEMNGMLNTVPVEITRKDEFVSKTPSRNFDLYRWKIASWIISLQELMK